MRTAETASTLAAFDRRGPGTDAERRAANWLADQLALGRRQARIDPFWCRPNWALAQAWHVALGLAGSLVSVSHPRLGAGLLLGAIVCMIADWQLGLSPGRLLTPERASQNVVSHVPGATKGRRVHLIITANYDAGRLGSAQRLRHSALLHRIRSATRGVLPGWIAWVVLALVLALLTALARLENGAHHTTTGILQLPPTIGLVIALALLVENGTADYSPGIGDNGSGVAAAIALALALDISPPALSAVEVVLSGAGDVQGIGLRRYLWAHRRTHNETNTVVLGIAPCGAGTLHWWNSDGPLVPAGFYGRLRQLCAQLPALDPSLTPAPHRGRGCSPALPGRMRGIPSITIGCLGPAGVAPHSHLSSDTEAVLRSETLDGIVQAGLMLVDELDAYLAELPPPSRAKPATRARRRLRRA